MKKSLIAIAALAAATGASAQVTLYGRANLVVDQFSATGSASTATDIAGRMRLVDSSSRFGVRVNEDLGGGNRAFVVCETGINIDNGNFAGQVSPSAASAIVNTSANTWCSREGHVGLGNASAEIRLGRQNVYWTHGELNQTGANFLNTDVLGSFYAAGSGMTLGTASRLNNTVMLVLNKGLAGAFEGTHLYYAFTGESKGSGVNGAQSTNGTANATSNAQNATASTMGFKINWNQGPWAAMADYAKVSDSASNTLATTNVNQSSMKGAVGFKYTPNSIVSVTYWQHSHEFSDATTAKMAPTLLGGPGGLFGGGTTYAAQAVTAAGNRKQAGFGVNLVHDLGAGLFGYAQYAKMNDASDYSGATVAGTGANAYLVGVRKNLSARTGVYASYMVINNDKNNAINFVGGAYTAGVVQAGADPKVIGVGVMHNF